MFAVNAMLCAKSISEDSYKRIESHYLASQRVSLIITNEMVADQYKVLAEMQSAAISIVFGPETPEQCIRKQSICLSKGQF